MAEISPTTPWYLGSTSPLSQGNPNRHHQDDLHFKAITMPKSFIWHWWERGTTGQLISRHFFCCQLVFMLMPWAYPPWNWQLDSENWWLVQMTFLLGNLPYLSPANLLCRFQGVRRFLCPNSTNLRSLVVLGSLKGWVGWVGGLIPPFGWCENNPCKLMRFQLQVPQLVSFPGFRTKHQQFWPTRTSVVVVDPMDIVGTFEVFLLF